MLLVVMLVAAGLRWIVNSHALSGPVVMSLTHAHGVHMNDWVSIALWAAALLIAVPSLATRRIEVRWPAVLRRATLRPALVPVRAHRR